MQVCFEFFAVTHTQLDSEQRQPAHHIELCTKYLGQHTIANVQGPIINVHAEISSDARDLKLVFINAPDRGQLKTPLTIDKCGSKIARNSVVDCHLSLVR